MPCTVHIHITTSYQNCIYKLLIAVQQRLSTEQTSDLQVILFSVFSKRIQLYSATDRSKIQKCKI